MQRGCQRISIAAPKMLLSPSRSERMSSDRSAWVRSQDKRRCLSSREGSESTRGKRRCLYLPQAVLRRLSIDDRHHLRAAAAAAAVAAAGQAPAGPPPGGSAASRGGLHHRKQGISLWSEWQRKRKQRQCLPSSFSPAAPPRAAVRPGAGAVRFCSGTTRRGADFAKRCTVGHKAKAVSYLRICGAADARAR